MHVKGLSMDEREGKMASLYKYITSEAYRLRLKQLSDVTNDKQPRMGPKEDPELQRQIEANEGLFEPLLVEPHPEHREKFRIIDGDRRWTNSKVLVEAQNKEQYRTMPVEITDRTLTDNERLRVWIYIHRQRKEWNAKEKERVAYRLVEFAAPAYAGLLRNELMLAAVTRFHWMSP